MLTRPIFLYHVTIQEKFLSMFVKLLVSCLQPILRLSAAYCLGTPIFPVWVGLDLEVQCKQLDN